MGYIYKLDFTNGKSYIGLTANTIEKRFSQHVNAAKLGKSQLPIYLAWRKYGKPVLTILAELQPENLDFAEIEAIQKYNTLIPNGYNVALGGMTAPTKSPEVAKKLSLVLTGRTLSDSHRQNMREAHKHRTKYSQGYKHSTQALEKIKNALKGNTYAKGKPKSEETKRKMSISIKKALEKRKQSLT